MFKFFKDKLKSWLGKSKEEIEEKASESKRTGLASEEEEVEEAKKEEKIEEIKKVEKKPKKVEKSSLLEKETSERKEVEKELKELEKRIEEKESKPVMKYNIALEKFEPDIEKTKEIIEIGKRTAPTIKEIEEEKEKEEKKPGIFQRLKERFSYKLSEEDFEEIFNSLEMLLLENNVALEAVEAIKKQIKIELISKEIKKQNLEQEIKTALKKAIENLLIEPDDLIETVKLKKPFIIVFFGINGVGKTTVIAKIAHLLLKNKISCVLAASDTFRAASIEQLQFHANKLKIKLIKHDYGADPAAVAFDAIKHAKAQGIEVVLIDTAGRMHTKENLLSEMEKICRVTKPDLKIFVAESIAGNDAVQQAKHFNEIIGIDGSILTKADVDEKGGTAISISYATQKPIFYLGTGQNYEDLKPFDKEEFIKELGF